MKEYKTLADEFADRTQRLPRDNQQMRQLAHLLTFAILQGTSEDRRGVAAILRGARYRRLAFAILASLADQGRLDVQKHLLGMLWWHPNYGSD